MGGDLAWHIGSLQWVFTEWINENLPLQKNQLYKKSSTNLYFNLSRFCKIFRVIRAVSDDSLIQLALVPTTYGGIRKWATPGKSHEFPLPQIPRGRAEARIQTSWILVLYTSHSATFLLGIKYTVSSCVLETYVANKQDCRFQKRAHLSVWLK